MTREELIALHAKLHARLLHILWKRGYQNAHDVYDRGSRALWTRLPSLGDITGEERRMYAAAAEAEHAKLNAAEATPG